MGLADIRKDYTQKELTEKEAKADPLEQFRLWIDEALAAQLPEPNAMTLATCTANGKPSARVVLLRGFDERGFAFYTNRQSHKGRELAQNPQASLVFYWPTLERQVRIEGHVELTSDKESDAYFASRPRGSQLAALASDQSEVIPDRKYLDRRVEKLTQELADKPVPRPPHWGGYRVVPAVMEFWQGRGSRLHDRLRYRRTERGWVRERVAP